MNATLRLLLTAAALLPACSGPEYSRAADDPEIDEPALSTRLDKRDLDLALVRWTEELEASPFLATLTRRPSIAILAIRNESSEHISGTLGNLLSAAETALVQSGRWSVINNTVIMQDAVAAERLREAGGDVDPATMAALGKQLGIEYFVDGRVGDAAEKTDDARRVQYALFLRVTEVATLRIVHQTRVDVTKQENG